MTLESLYAALLRHAELAHELRRLARCGDASSLLHPARAFVSVAAIRIFDAADTATTLATGAYRAAPARMAAASCSPGAAAAGPCEDGIEIDVVLGYGEAASDTPEPLRRAMLTLVAHWRENRGDEASDDAAAEAGRATRAALSPRAAE